MPTRQSHRVHLLRYTVVLTSAATLACGGGSATKEIATLHSWRATIDLAAEGQLKGWVTPRYVAQLRDQARIELATTSDASAYPKIPAAQRDSLAAARRDLASSLERLRRIGR